MVRKLDISHPRWRVHAAIVGTVLVTACGWIGGDPPPPTPTALPIITPSPSPQANPTLPSPSPPPSPSPGPSPVAGDSYTVAEGDTLATIAERFYGDPSLWRRIYEANQSAIGDNPDSVRVGTTLTIPPGP
jgi:nucleoid-associated protein YgaU